MEVAFFLFIKFLFSISQYSHQKVLLSFIFSFPSHLSAKSALHLVNMIVSLNDIYVNTDHPIKIVPVYFHQFAILGFIYA